MGIFLYFRKRDESGEIGVTIDIAAQDGKIDGNKLRKIIYDEIQLTQKIDDQTIDLKEFSLTNLEGKLDEWTGEDEKKSFCFLSVIINHLIVASSFSSLCIRFAFCFSHYLFFGYKIIFPLKKSSFCKPQIIQAMLKMSLNTSTITMKSRMRMRSRTKLKRTIMTQIVVPMINLHAKINNVLQLIIDVMAKNIATMDLTSSIAGHQVTNPHSTKFFCK